MARKRSGEQMVANGDAVETDEEMYDAIDAAADSDEVQERAAIIEDLGGEDAETTAERDAILGELDEEATREFEEGVDEGFRQVADRVGSAKPAKPNETKVQRECACGCGETTRGGRFKPGHDARLRGQLLKGHDAGDATATEALIEHGWFTAHDLDDRKAMGAVSDAEKAERKRLRLSARLHQARQLVAELEAQLSAL